MPHPNFYELLPVVPKLDITVMYLLQTEKSRKGLGRVIQILGNRLCL